MIPSLASLFSAAHIAADTDIPSSHFMLVGIVPTVIFMSVLKHEADVYWPQSANEN